MSGKWTPGPWTKYPVGADFWIGTKHPTVGFVSHAAVRPGCDEASELGDLEANATLIAAAPELLEALRTAKDIIRVWHGPTAWDIYDRASPEMTAINAALAKAEGRS